RDQVGMVVYRGDGLPGQSSVLVRVAFSEAVRGRSTIPSPSRGPLVEGCRPGESTDDPIRARSGSTRDTTVAKPWDRAGPKEPGCPGTGCTPHRESSFPRLHSSGCSHASAIQRTE